jgi:hypothetical protein
MRFYVCVFIVVLSACASRELPCGAHLSPINAPTRSVPPAPHASMVPRILPPGSMPEKADEVLR